jgi:hypothetical protein
MEDIGRSPDGFAIAFEASFARFQICVEGACGGRENWPSGVAVAIHAAFELAAADPEMASTLTNEALAAGPDGIARHRRLLAYVAECLIPGRERRPDGPELPQITEQALAGGLVGLVAERVARGGAAELPALAPQAIQFALTPYLGAGEAKRIATSAARPSPRADR